MNIYLYREKNKTNPIFKLIYLGHLRLWLSKSSIVQITLSWKYFKNDTKWLQVNQVRFEILKASCSVNDKETSLFKGQLISKAEVFIWTKIWAITFMIWPILESRAEIQKYFRSFFGSNENLKICLEINWPLGYGMHLYILPCNLGFSSMPSSTIYRGVLCSFYILPLSCPILSKKSKLRILCYFRWLGIGLGRGEGLAYLEKQERKGFRSMIASLQFNNLAT